MCEVHEVNTTIGPKLINKDTGCRTIIYGVHGANRRGEKIESGGAQKTLQEAQKQ